MIKCCTDRAKIVTAKDAGDPNAGPESGMLPGESLECYAKRTGNPSGKMDDATGTPENKIANTGIFVKAADASVNEIFKLTPTSTTRTPTTWTLTPALPAPIAFVSNGATATLSGTFAPSSLGQKFEVLVTASDADGEIDSRTFKFSPQKATNTNSITMISPLPGGQVNSKFGPRIHPITKQEKLHTGVDMKMSDRSTKDIVAAADGKVIFAGVSGTLTSGYGNCIRIEHANGSGEMLCRTVYGHLAKIYVTVGQTVAAGQRIGLEGSTGSSTGNHLHFEVRLPNDTPVDPVPYMRDNMDVAITTSPTGDAEHTEQSGGGKSAVTSDNNAAQEKDCPAGDVDPKTGTQTPAPPAYAPPTSADAFEKAWFFTMTHEVGPHWMTKPEFSPGDSELDAGLIETALQRKKTGYKPGPNFPGGETKFGVAQNPNQGKVKVETLTYDQAKSFGKSNYWSSRSLDGKPPLIAIMMFDLNYLHGPGNANKILTDASINATATSKEEQVTACEAITKSALNFISGLNPKYQNGWIARTNDRLAYVKSLPIPLA